MGFLQGLLDGSAVDPAGLTPHGFCLTWNPALLWLEGGSDALIFLAYFSIPLTLVPLVRTRSDAQYRGVAWLFLSFILACGATHALAIVTLWVPAYLPEGLLKLVTAALSVGTAVALRPLVPLVMAMPSRADVERLNGELQRRIAEQDRATVALRESQTRLLLAQDAGQVGSWELDIYGETVCWSAAQYALYGLEPGEVPLTRQAWLACLDPMDRHAVASRLVQAAICDSEYEAEFRLRLPDGGIRWVAERGRVVASDHIGSVRMVGVSVDVTERRWLAESNRHLTARAAEEAFARQEAAEQMQLMFEHSPDALFVVRVDAAECDPASPRFAFEAINPVTERLSGRPASDFVGRRPEDCYPPDQARDLVAAYGACVAADRVITVPIRRCVRGREREFETALAPLRDPRSGRVQRIIGAARDVTERADLERQLRHVAKMEATNRLTGGIAHDFNNLLQALMGGLEMLLLEVEAPSAREYAEVALHAARRGAELTHRLLAFSRQQTLQPQSVDTGTLLGYVTGLLERTLPPQVRLAVVPPPVPVVTVADPGQLEAALVNLVVNSADAMPEGGRIDVAAALGTPPAELGLAEGAYAVISVTDSGRGMEAAVLQQCCEPFFTTKGPHGSGLGLSMVQGFARQSGGELRIRSAPGAGTDIQIWLPAAPVGEPGGGPAAAAPAQVLLVDDAPDVLVTAGAFLRHGGFRVTRVGSGREALAHLEQGEPCDALVTDLAMPDLNGVELLERARALRPGLPALIITGFDHMAMRGGDLQARVLKKPFGRLTLVEEVSALLDRVGRPGGRRDDLRRTGAVGLSGPLVDALADP